MRVLIAHSFYRILGGENRYVEQQADLLGRLHDVELLIRDNHDLPPGLTTAAHMTYSAREQAAVVGALDRFSPDVIHLHNAYPSLGPAVHLAAARRGVPLIMTVHNFRLRCPNGYMFTQGKACRRCEGGAYANAVMHRCFPSRRQAAAYALGLWTHRFVFRLEDKVDMFITPSNFMRARLLDWGIPAERITTVPNFTSLSHASASPGTYGAYVGRLSSEKGIEVLLRALVAAGDPPLHIAGDGPMRSAAEALAAKLGLTHTRFLGRLTAVQVATELRRARFVVLPSVCEENAPLAALEAMAAARPLLVSDGGGLPELVAAGGGLISPVGGVEELAANIRTLMDDRDLCRRLGEQSFRVARVRFSPQAHLSLLEAAYGAVVGADQPSLARDAQPQARSAGDLP